MKLRSILRATTAVTAVGIAFPLGAVAAEVKAGGALDLTISGFIRAEAGGGQQNDLQLDNDKARGLDFRNDSEVHVLAEGRSEETGLEYGATIKFEADTNETINTDETWLFLKGGWGELRMGDQDGVVENSIVGGQTIAAGTGGIDGSDFVILQVAGAGLLASLSAGVELTGVTCEWNGRRSRSSAAAFLAPLVCAGVLLLILRPFHSHVTPVSSTPADKETIILAHASCACRWSVRPAQ